MLSAKPDRTPELQQGKIIGGDFTMWKYLRNTPPWDLELKVGFHSGRLYDGFSIFLMSPADHVSCHEIELGASTRWSGSIIPGKDGTGRKIEDLLLSRGQNLEQIKQKVCDFLNLRGDNTPAKVVPVLRHAPGMVYPDAQVLGGGIRGGIPAFRLGVGKRFDEIVRFDAGYKCSF